MKQNRTQNKISPPHPCTCSPAITPTTSSRTQKTWSPTNQHQPERSRRDSSALNYEHKQNHAHKIKSAHRTHAQLALISTQLQAAAHTKPGRPPINTSPRTAEETAAQPCQSRVWLLLQPLSVHAQAHSLHHLDPHLLPQQPPATFLFPTDCEYPNDKHLT